MILDIVHNKEESTDVLFLIAEMGETTRIESVRINQDGKSITTRLWVSKKTLEEDIGLEYLDQYTIGMDKIYVWDFAKEKSGQFYGGDFFR